MDAYRHNEKQNRIETNLSPEEVEALKSQIMQMEQKIASMSLTLSLIDPRVISGIKPVGLLLYYILLPLYWLLRIMLLLTKPSFYWTGLYWICYGWIVILDGGVKDLAVLLKPRTIINILRTIVR